MSQEPGSRAILKGFPFQILNHKYAVAAKKLDLLSIKVQTGQLVDINQWQLEKELQALQSDSSSETDSFNGGPTEKLDGKLRFTLEQLNIYKRSLAAENKTKLETSSESN